MAAPPPQPAPDPPEEPVLGVDYGTVRIGVALGFRGTGLVVPLPVVPNPGEEAAAAAALAGLARERGVVRVVLGNPVHADGRPSVMSQRVARVAALLEESLDVPVQLQDERRTSKDAEARLAELGLRWWQFDKGRVDALAAMAIVRENLIQENPRLALLEDEPPPEPPPRRESRRDRRRRARRKR